jgi:imidazolonepropionase
VTQDRVTIFANAGEVLTCETRDEGSVHGSAAVAVRNGSVLAVGPQREILASYPDHETVDCAGGVLTPGFVDSHTHAVFGAWRSLEYEMRALGTPYMEIARRGGGIHASVRDVRGRTETELVELTRPRLSQMLRLGTTTVEVKSGYGLELEAELRMLRAVRRLGAEGPQDIVATFMGAHEVPVEFDGDAEGFARHVAEVMVPAVAADSLASFCDVFMEPGVFNAAQSRTVLEAARAHGMGLRLHADELETSGGAELAAELGAASADHLGAISDAGVEALAASSTVATLLPSTLFFLGRTRYAPARRLLDAGATVALATDFNPGSSPSMSMPLVLTLACSQMGMTPREAIHAATAGGARALRLEDGRGTLAPGAPADLILWDVAEHREIPYRFGWPPIGGVWRRGARVAGRF